MCHMQLFQLKTFKGFYLRELGSREKKQKIAKNV